MLWKDTYKIGAQLVDRQHEELFSMTNRLLDTINSGGDAAATKQNCIDSILFLKGYAVEHFKTEEEHMQSVGYCDLEAHKIIHKDFVTSVLDLEQKLVKSDFSMPVVKEFAGFLTAWLMYHVADTDQKIPDDEPISIKRAAATGFYVNCLAQSVSRVFSKMVGAKVTNFNFVPEQAGEGDIAVKIGLSGDNEGEAVFIFPAKAALGMVKDLASMELSGLDEIAYSALAEVSNIISGNAASLIADGGRVCTITPPQIVSGVSDTEHGFCFESQYGRISVCVGLV